MCFAQGPQRSDAGETRTHGPSVLSQALYHWATALPISIMWQYSECFHGYNKKEVKPHACFTVYETRNPYQVSAVYKYVIISTTIGNTSLK